VCLSHTHRHTLPKAHSNRIHISMSPHKFTYGWQIFQPYAGQNSQISSALLTNAASFPHMSSSVHHSEGTKPPPCIMYALIDLIETENVMFHSGALLIGWLSVTRLVRQLETIEPWVEMNLKGEVGTVGVSDCVCVFVLGVLASRESWRGVKPNWLTNYRCPFLAFVFTLPTVLSGWGNWALADQTRCFASLAQLEGFQS